MDEQERQRHLIDGLVGDEHADRYRKSIVFKSVVDTLAAYLPFMVDGLAAEADRQDERFARMIEAARTQPPLMSRGAIFRAVGLPDPGDGS